MKLYIKQRIFSIGDKYDIYDENENPVYHVESEIFVIGDKIHLYDMNGQELFFIKRHFTFFLKEYEIYEGGRKVAEVNQDFGIFVKKISVSGVKGNFSVTGDLFGFDYQIEQNGNYIGGVSKKVFSFTDSYELDISDNFDSGFFAALVVAIDNCMHNESNNN